MLRERKGLCNELYGRVLLKRSCFTISVISTVSQPWQPVYCLCKRWSVITARFGRYNCVWSYLKRSRYVSIIMHYYIVWSKYLPLWFYSTSFSFGYFSGSIYPPSALFLFHNGSDLFVTRFPSQSNEFHIPLKNLPIGSIYSHCSQASPLMVLRVYHAGSPSISHNIYVSHHRFYSVDFGCVPCLPD